MRIEEDIKLDYADVLLDLNKHTLKSQRRRPQKNYRFKYSNHQWSGIPIMAANMDGVGEIEIAKNLSKFGIITCLTKQHDIKKIKKFNYKRNTFQLSSKHRTVKQITSA